MIGINVERERKLNTQAVMDAERQRRMDAASDAFAVSQEEVPEDRGASGGLRGKMFEPTERSNGDIVYGVAGAPHAEPIEKGTQPFHPPTRPLVEWAERVAGDKGLGFYVANVKIPREGIDAQPYLSPGADRAKRWLDNHGLDRYL